jgi:hypothetical protein
MRVLLGIFQLIRLSSASKFVKSFDDSLNPSAYIKVRADPAYSLGTQLLNKPIVYIQTKKCGLFLFVSPSWQQLWLPQLTIQNPSGMQMVSWKQEATVVSPSRIHATFFVELVTRLSIVMLPGYVKNINIE